MKDESDQILKSILKKYRDNYLLHGDTPEGMFWSNKATQLLRFERLIRNLNLSAESTLHDVGCGIGSLYEYLLWKNVACKYSGSEIVSEMVASARNHHPGIEVNCNDFASKSVIQRYDYIVLSGTLNLLGDADVSSWKECSFSIIKKMFQQAEKAISFNFLTDYRTKYANPELMYFCPEELFTLCMKELSRYVTLDHGYPLFEATITVYKESTMQEQFPLPEFKKYFISKS